MRVTSSNQATRNELGGNEGQCHEMKRNNKAKKHPQLVKIRNQRKRKEIKNALNEDGPHETPSMNGSDIKICEAKRKDMKHKDPKRTRRNELNRTEKRRRKRKEKENEEKTTLQDT